MNLVFDVDDTLYDLMKPFIKTHDKFFAGQTEIDPKELFVKSRIASNIVLDLEKDGKILPEDAYFRRMQLTYEHTGISVSRELSDRFDREYRYQQAHIELFDFIPGILDDCAGQQVRLAVLTNGRGSVQRQKIHALGLERWIDEADIFVSGEIGYQKPDRKAFRFVERQLGIHPEDTWYVGDTYQSDMIGAKEAGWHAVWLNHRENPEPLSANAADAEVRSGEQLAKLIHHLIRRERIADGS